MSAVAVFKGPVINGTVHFKNENNFTRVYIDLAGSGLTPNGKQMFFIHEYGDVRNECENIGKCMVPGILFVDVLGNAKYATILKSNELLGRSLVIYDTNGKRIACAVIGIASN